MSKTICSIDVYTSPEAAFLVNSFIVETANGCVVIDTQFLISTARELKKKIEESGKPLLAVIVSHPHPDHFNGTFVLAEGINDLPVYATKATLEAIKESEAEKREFWTKSYGDDYPPQTFFPNRILQPHDELTIDGARFVINEPGAGESAVNSVVYLPDKKVLFASDLIYERAPPWLAVGRSAAWLEHLERVKKRLPGSRNCLRRTRQQNDFSGARRAGGLHKKVQPVSQKCDERERRIERRKKSRNQNRDAKTLSKLRAGIFD